MSPLPVVLTRFESGICLGRRRCAAIVSVSLCRQKPGGCHVIRYGVERCIRWLLAAAIKHACMPASISIA